MNQATTLVLTIATLSRIAQASELPQEAAACSPSRGSALPELAQVTHREACRSFEPFHSVEIPDDPSAPVDCSAFGVIPGRSVLTFDDALGLDCDVLALRPSSPTVDPSNDPIGDLALACRALIARQHLETALLGMIPGLHGGTAQTRARRDIRGAMGETCAQQAFGAIYRKPQDDHAGSGLLDWGDREADLAAIERSSLDAGKKAALKEKVNSGALTVEGRTPPIDPNGFVAMINAVIAEEFASSGIRPSARRESRSVWSSEFKDCVGKRMPWTHALNKQLTVLALGRGDQFTPTGAEEALHSWILAQPDFSIEPKALFREAYQLAGGDLTEAIRTIENVLSRHWTTSARETLVQTRKLKPITHTLGVDEDVFGSWYHFFGIMLYAFTRGNSVTPILVEESESLGSHVLSGFEPEPQENRINRAGAVVGNRLRRSLERGDWEALDADEVAKASQLENYVRSAEDGDYDRVLKGR